MRMFIDEFTNNPRCGTRYPDAKLLMKFAKQSIVWGFTALDLTAGKFPIAGIKAAWWPPAKQERAITAQNDCGSNLDDFLQDVRGLALPLPPRSSRPA